MMPHTTSFCRGNTCPPAYAFFLVVLLVNCAAGGERYNNNQEQDDGGAQVPAIMPPPENSNSAGDANLAEPEPAPASVPVAQPNASLSPNFAVIYAGPAPTSSAGDGSASVGPTYVTDANMNAQAGVPRGRWCTFVMAGADSNFYTGKDPLLSKSYAPINRNVYVYVPANYKVGTVAPVLVEGDAQWARGYLTNVLDNLIAKRALPPLVAVAIDNGGGDSRGSQRGLEYDVVSGKYGEFVDQEVLATAESKCQVTLSKDPALRGTMGFSSSGAAAISMAWWHPELYGRVVTYSATMVAQFPTSDFPEGAWAYPTRLFAGSKTKNLRIFLWAGQQDNNAGSNGNYDFLLANRKACAELSKKGYHVQFLYGLGAGHVDAKAVNQTLPAALTWAWRGWQDSLK